MLPSRWVMRAPEPDALRQVLECAGTVSLPPLVLRLLALRGICTPQDMERAGRSRRLPLRSARALVRMVSAGEFDEARFRAALLEAA